MRSGKFLGLQFTLDEIAVEHQPRAVNERLAVVQKQAQLGGHHKPT